MFAFTLILNLRKKILREKFQQESLVLHLFSMKKFLPSETELWEY